MESLDTKLFETTSVITSSDLDEYILTCSGCDPDKGRSSTRSRGSSGDIQFTSMCPYLSVLQKRVDERQRIRELLSRFTAEAKLSLDDVMRRAETDSNRTLLDALQRSKVENLQMDSKIRFLEVSRRYLCLRYIFWLDNLLFLQYIFIITEYSIS